MKNKIRFVKDKEEGQQFLRELSQKRSSTAIIDSRI
jgi:hypothetical protein